MLRRLIGYPAPRPVLIDVAQAHETWVSCTEEIDGRWYTARPLGTRPWRTRIYHAWLILCGRASAFQYYRDVKEMMS